MNETLEKVRKAAKERRKKLLDKIAENTRNLGEDKFVDPDGGGKGPRYYVNQSQKHWLDRMEDREDE